MSMGVYAILNNENGKLYIGSSADLDNRKSFHFQGLRRGVHSNSHLQYAFDRYGGDSFQFLVVEIVGDRNLLLEREQYWLDLSRSYAPQNGYNITLTATGGSNPGRVFTEAHRRKISDVQKGRVFTQEHKDRIRITKHKQSAEIYEACVVQIQSIVGELLDQGSVVNAHLVSDRVSLGVDQIRYYLKPIVVQYKLKRTSNGWKE